MKTLFAASMLIVCASPALAGVVSSINGVNVRQRIFNDFPSSSLAVTNNYPAQVRFNEGPFGAADPDTNGFANRHSAYFSNDGGATAFDFNYEDGFDAQFKMSLSTDQRNGKEAGFHSDLFGFGFFGVLPNGVIAAFGSIFEFHDFGVVPGALTGDVSLRMIYTPGNGDGTIGGAGTIRSTFEYMYSIGNGWVSSGPKNIGNGEGGIPSAFPFFVGMGVQNSPQGATFSDTTFSNIVIVPAPGAAAMLCVAGLVGLRRRR